MHGKDASPEDKWYPWFREVCEENGWEYQAPVLPKADEPVFSE